MNSTAVAARLNITPKKLRRIIRKNPDLVTKVEGEYLFTEDHVSQLSELIQPSAGEDGEIQFLDSDEPMLITEVSRVWTDRAVRARASEQYRSRQARLMARMTEVGVA